MALRGAGVSDARGREGSFLHPPRGVDTGPEDAGNDQRIPYCDSSHSGDLAGNLRDADDGLLHEGEPAHGRCARARMAGIRWGGTTPGGASASEIR